MPSDHVTLLTAPGVAAIAVVRLSGSGVDDFLARYFSKPVPMHRCVHGMLRDGNRIIDDALAVRTGDRLDLNLHGGTWVVQSAIQLAVSNGFTSSDQDAIDAPSELWQEVLTALPLAKTEQQVRMLLAQPKAWESIDHPQEVLDDSSGRWLVEQPRVAIVGPANVGKSTLANQLFGQDRSITANVPGTTRDWVGEIANLDGLAIMLVDTPGQRETDDPIEDAAIVASQDQIQSADLVVLVLDQSLPLNLEMLRRYPASLCVANKADAQAKWNAAEITAIQTVALTGQGVESLRAAIRQFFSWQPIDFHRPRWWTERQRQSLLDMTFRSDR